MEIWAVPGTFGFELVWSPPPPHGNLVRTWHIGFELVWSTPSPNGYLVRTRHFGIELVWSPPPPTKYGIWSGLGTLDLSLSEYFPPPWKWKFGQDLALWIWVGLESHKPPPQISYVGAGVWILITVSPMVTASFMICLHVCHTVNYKIELRFIWHYTQRRCFQNGNMKDTFCQSYEVYYFGMQHS